MKRVFLIKFLGIHVVSILSAIFLLFAVSNANALIIQVENTSQNGETIDSIYLGFNDLDNPVLFYISNIDLPFEAVYLTEDIPEISIMGSALVMSSVIGNLESFNKTYDPGVPLNAGPGNHIDIGSKGAYESARLSFIIPEPTSFLLLGSGLLGLWVRRKTK